MKHLSILSLLFLAVLPGAALAHSGEQPSGLLAGFLHPLTGLDHLLVMLAVGIFAVRQGAKSLWVVPLVFVATLFVSGSMSMSGAEFYYLQQAVIGSVIVMGGLILLRKKMPLMLSVLLSAGFAALHGYVQGSEIVAGHNISAYMAGCSFTSALLVAGGMIIGRRLSFRGKPTDRLIYN